MTDTDTSAEAVERLAEFYFDRASFGFIYGGTTVEGAQEWNAMMKTRAAQAHATLRALLARAEKAEAERDRAVEARTEAIKIMADMSRQAGSWQGIAEGKDVVIRQLEAEQDRLRAAILDTAPHDAGLVPMRLRLMAKGETPITDPTPGGWSVALACELEAAYYGGADRGPPTVNVRWLQVANHVAALVEAARREGEAREREACKALARDISPPSHIGLGDALGFCEACEHIAAAIRARGDA